MRAMARMLLAAVLLSAGNLMYAQAVFHYPPPAPGAVTVSNDVTYGAAADGPLMMDVHRPAKAAGPLPALIFFNQSVGEQRRAFTHYRRWAETAASQGVVAIVPDLHQVSAAADFATLLTHLGERAPEYGIDRDAIAVYGASGNAFAALPLLQDPKQTAVKALVVYYGMGEIKEWRLDLPVLVVRAGLDRPALNTIIDTAVAQAAAQNAPVTLLNHPTGHHGFEGIDDGAVTHAVIEQTIAFVKTATSRAYRASLSAGLPEAVAAGHMTRQNYAAAAAAYAPLVAARPGDARLGLSYGEALLANGQFAEACKALETLKGKGLGPRDLGLPAARACMRSGDADRAIAWLQSIPQRFLPPSVQQDPVFEPLAGRPAFQALFKKPA
jgi:dienelactone hydrolase